MTEIVTKIVGRRTRVVRTEAIEIEGGEMRPIPHSRDGKQYRVDLAIIEWESDGGGDTWRNPRVEARGQVLKRDGSDSKNRTDERFWRNEGQPAWLTEIVDDTDPSTQ